MTSTETRQPGDDDAWTPAIDDEPAETLTLGDALAAIEASGSDLAAQVAADVTRGLRAPPSAVSAERALLGAVLLSPPAFDLAVEAGVRTEDFYRPAHATIWAAIEEVRARREPVDTLTVVDQLQRQGRLDDVGGTAALAQLAVLLPTAAHAAAYARLVHDKAMLRRLAELGTHLVQLAHSQRTDSRGLIAEAQTSVLALTLATRTASQLVDRDAAIARVTTAGVEGRDPPGALGTGFPDLDDMLRGGPRPGQLVLIAARPAMGKSALMLCMAKAMADTGTPVAIASLEMSGDELMERELASDARRPYASWVRRDVASRVAQAAGIASARPLHINDTPGLSITEICSFARRMKAQHGIGTLFVDHVGLVKASDRYAGQRVHEVTEISGALRALAGELQIRVVALSQLNRGLEGRPDKRPGLGDLRDSGSLEQDAQVVIFVHRPEYYMREATPPDLVRVAELIVAKNRGGATGTVRLLFDAPTTSFITPRPANEESK